MDTTLYEVNDVDDDVESQNLDAFVSVVPLDEGMGQQEASMKIVPYVVKPKVPPLDASNDENKIYMDMGRTSFNKLGCLAATIVHQFLFAG